MSARRLFAGWCLVAALACRRAPSPPPPPVATKPVAPAPAAPAVAAALVPEEPLVGEAPETNPKSETVTIKLIVDQSRKARVFWGRKDLGLAPLELTRPRGSGPLDLVVIAPGALPLHTRVFTDRDDKLALRLWAESEAPSLLGYRAEPPAPEKTASDKGARRPLAERQPRPAPLP